MFYALCNFDFKIYVKDKWGNYGLIYSVLADVTDCYASWIITYLIPPINNSEKGKCTWPCHGNSRRHFKFLEKSCWGLTLPFNWCYWRTVQEKNDIFWNNDTKQEMSKCLMSKWKCLISKWFEPRTTYFVNEHSNVSKLL